jgi:hypothetical protein
MGILLAFAPFIAFAVIERLFGATPGLLSGVAASAVLVARDTLAKGGGAKLLEVGTLLLFSALAIYSMFASPDWSILGVRLCVDAGLLLIVILSLAMGRPFTVQYAREQVPRELWSSPEFIRTNAVITSVWGLAFAIVVGADLVMLFVPELPMRHSIVVTVLALVGAFKFSAWYPDRDRARPQRPVI